MPRTRLCPTEARGILARTNAWGRDFFALPAEVVCRLLEEADRLGYRRPRNANGSRGRYFHAHLTRVAHRAEARGEFSSEAV